MGKSKSTCKRLIQDILNEGVTPTDLCCLILDHDSIRFWCLLAPYCFSELYDIPKMDLSVKGKKSGLTLSHVCAFWGDDKLLDVLISVDQCDPNIQDVEGFTILHYLVERCVRFWDDNMSKTLISTLHMLKQNGVQFHLTDHRNFTAAEVFDAYLSKGSFSWDGCAEAGADVMEFRKLLKKSTQKQTNKQIVNNNARISKGSKSNTSKVENNMAKVQV